MQGSWATTSCRFAVFPPSLARARDPWRNSLGWPWTSLVELGNLSMPEPMAQDYQDFDRHTY